MPAPRPSMHTISRRAQARVLKTPTATIQKPLFSPPQSEQRNCQTSRSPPSPSPLPQSPPPLPTPLPPPSRSNHEIKIKSSNLSADLFKRLMENTKHFVPSKMAQRLAPPSPQPTALPQRSSPQLSPSVVVQQSYNPYRIPIFDSDFENPEEFPLSLEGITNAQLAAPFPVCEIKRARVLKSAASYAEENSRSPILSKIFVYMIVPCCLFFLQQEGNFLSLQLITHPGLHMRLDQKGVNISTFSFINYVRKRTSSKGRLFVAARVNESPKLRKRDRPVQLLQAQGEIMYYELS